MCQFAQSSDRESLDYKHDYYLLMVTFMMAFFIGELWCSTHSDVFSYCKIRVFLGKVLIEKFIRCQGVIFNFATGSNLSCYALFAHDIFGVNPYFPNFVFDFLYDST